MAFKEVALDELQVSPFTKFDKDWALVTAGTLEDSNTMTVSWGGVGTMWSLPVATIYIRPQRYTKEFIDREDRFTVPSISARSVCWVLRAGATAIRLPRSDLRPSR